MDRRNSSPLSFTLPSFLLCLSLCTTRLCLGSDTISVNQSLSGNQILISSGGTFRLGFFTPGKSPYSYIGIWYNKVSVQTVVWVANRDNPVTDRYSTELKISGGNLVMVNDSRVPVWSTNLSTSSSGSSSTVAVLRDDGNFALKDGPNSSVILWQSFDHPTDTWLPGAKLAIDKRKNTSQFLTSWKNSEDPSTGLFSLQPQPSSEYFMLWNRSFCYWSTGRWDSKNSVFDNVPELRANFIFIFSFVDNENESYFTYSRKNSSNDTSRVVMDFSGQIQELFWLPSQQWNMFWSKPPRRCQVHNLCGPFGVCSELNTDDFCSCLPGFSITSPRDWNLGDMSSGCKRNSNWSCALSTSDGGKDRFLLSSNMKLPADPLSLPVRNVKECRLSCLNNCSCTAYAFENNTCSIWFGNLFNVQKLAQGDTTASSFYLRLAASNVEDLSKKIVAGSVGAALMILVILLFGIWRWRRRATVTVKSVEGSLRAYAYRDLLIATKNFSEKLGKGGFGSVFKGTLPDSTHIAVKKLESISQGDKQFRTEVSTIGTIQHVNLVRLRGFCSEGRRNSEVSENGNIKFFPSWAARKISEGGDLLDLLDPNLEANVDTEELTRICRVACWCVQDEEKHRPSMGQVVPILEGVLGVNQPQIPRALQLLVDNQEHIVFFTESSSSNQSSQMMSNTSTASLQNQNSSSSTNSNS
ncbi:hypothetical protein NL676_017548 [Syzygium grande]|nr:hypothetical protein NL676_017548 [Syzygium grande]